MSTAAPEKTLQEFIADRMRKYYKVEPTPFALEVLEILSFVETGFHHIDEALLKRTDWTGKAHIEVTRYGGVATYDYNLLTRLVVACHDRKVRLSIEPCNPKYLRLRFHKRTCREGGFSERHPTIEMAIADVRKHFVTEGE